MESSILTDEEQEIFRNLFIENNKLFINNQCNLIYRGSRDGFDKESCIEKVYDKQNIVILIQSQNGNVFGGYTKAGWDSDLHNSSDYTADKDAFVFQIRSSAGYKPFISNVKQDEKSVSQALAYYISWYWCMVGSRWIFSIGGSGDAPRVYHLNPRNYEEFEHNLPFLGCSDASAERTNDVLIELEAFQIQS